jgi:predicted transcriptional regulator
MVEFDISNLQEGQPPVMVYANIKRENKPQDTAIGLSMYDVKEYQKRSTISDFLREGIDDIQQLNIKQNRYADFIVDSPDKYEFLWKGEKGSIMVVTLTEEARVKLSQVGGSEEQAILELLDGLSGLSFDDVAKIKTVDII